MKAGEFVTLIRDESKVTAVVEDVLELGVNLVNLGFFYLEPVPNHPEIPLWQVADEAIAEKMADFMDGMGYLRESANGFRGQLLSDGWSETMAEQLAAGLLAHMIAASFAGRS